MKKRLLSILLAVLLLSGCTPAPEEDETLHVLATTYPVYLFTTALTQGMEGVEVDLLVNSQTSCLHDYTLTVKDMKAIEKANVIVMNGAGLEDFMADALAQSDAVVIDCSQGLELLPTLDHHGHDGHDHEEEYDPHFWMDPGMSVNMLDTIANGLSLLFPEQTETFDANRTAAVEALIPLQDLVETVRKETPQPAFDYYREHPEVSSFLPWQFAPKLITFHDGFQYFAEGTGFYLLKAIEEEEGSTASAQEIKEIVALIEEYDIPAIFVEKNGSRATAEVIARETGCKIYELDMLMSGDGAGIQPYLDAMDANIKTVLEALS